ncbi:MAG: hypothetical protein ACRC33_02150, partial [Gemmataceae bacterium]
MAGIPTLAEPTAVYDAPVPPRAGADHAEDTRALLHRQLRSLVRLYLILFGVSAAVRLAPLAVGKPHLMSALHLVAAPVVLGAMLAAAWYVGSARRPGLAGLRWVELLLFGLLTVLMTFSQFKEVADPDVRRYAAFGSAGVGFRLSPFALQWVFVILLYGLFVPNPLWRAVAVTAAM